MITTHVVALSGGKDSTAMALRLAEVEPKRYTYICTPTGDELPAMLAHWNRLEELLQSPLLRLPEMTLKALIQRKRMLPNFRARFCTHHLKIVPFERWLLEHLPCLAYVGLRADEEREGVSYGIELLVRTRYPLAEWGICVPERTDCARCPLQSLPEWHRLWRDHPAIYEDACQDEDAIGHTYRSPGRDTWPAQLRSLAAEFSTGKVPKPRNRERTVCRVCSM